MSIYIVVIVYLDLYIVATTYHNDKWSHKWVNLKSGYNVGSSQENLIGNHNSILPTTYIKFSWSMLQLLYTYPNVYALSSCPLFIHHISTSRLSCHVHMPWHHTSLISVIHVYTMCILWETHVSWCHSISRLFPILLDSRSFQTTLGLWHHVMWLPSHMLSLSL